MGQVFAGRYELLEPIADGGMGSVWQVHDRREDDVKAAKILRQQDASSLLRFIREQATRIHHPNVVTPLGWAGEDDAVLFTMPLLRGGSVAMLVSDHGALPEQWVTEILDQTLAALEAVHAAGVVHRDVKPANLLLEASGRDVPRVRLSDFGVAVSENQPRLTAADAWFGTPGYMPPEQTGDPDPRHDLYAAAATGIHLLTGQKPPGAVDVVPDTALGRLLLRAVGAESARPQSAGEFRRLLRETVPMAPWDPGDVAVLGQYDAALAAAPADPTVLREPAGAADTVLRRPEVRRPEVRAAEPTLDPEGPRGSRSDRALWPAVALALLGVVFLVVAGWLLL